MSLSISGTQPRFSAFILTPQVLSEARRKNAYRWNAHYSPSKRGGQPGRILVKMPDGSRYTLGFSKTLKAIDLANRRRRKTMGQMYPKSFSPLELLGIVKECIASQAFKKDGMLIANQFDVALGSLQLGILNAITHYSPITDLTTILGGVPPTLRGRSSSKRGKDTETMAVKRALNLWEC